MNVKLPWKYPSIFSLDSRFFLCIYYHFDTVTVMAKKRETILLVNLCLLTIDIQKKKKKLRIPPVAIRKRKLQTFFVQNPFYFCKNFV